MSDEAPKRKIRRKPAPAVRLRELLQEARREGLEFEDAWDRAFAQMTREKSWPHNTKRRAEEKAYLNAWKDRQWRPCYYGEPTPLDALFAALGLDTDPDEIATDEEVIGALVLA